MRRQCAITYNLCHVSSDRNRDEVVTGICTSSALGRNTEILYLQQEDYSVLVCDVMQISFRLANYILSEPRMVTRI